MTLEKEEEEGKREGEWGRESGGKGGGGGREEEEEVSEPEHPTTKPCPLLENTVRNIHLHQEGKKLFDPTES